MIQSDDRASSKSRMSCVYYSIRNDIEDQTKGSHSDVIRITCVCERDSETSHWAMSV
jgi:hypothetical protein